MRATLLTLYYLSHKFQLQPSLMVSIPVSLYNLVRLSCFESILEKLTPFKGSLLNWIRLFGTKAVERNQTYKNHEKPTHLERGSQKWNCVHWLCIFILSAHVTFCLFCAFLSTVPRWDSVTHRQNRGLWENTNQPYRTLVCKLEKLYVFLDV